MKYTIGIDEVGRGALAGPVLVSATCVPKTFRADGLAQKFGALRDSKKLSKRQRERWFLYFSAHKNIHFAVARMHPRAIDAINISRAANRAAGKAFARLISRHGIDVEECEVFLDGGLYLGNKRRLMPMVADDIRAHSPKNQRTSPITMVRADEKITAVKIASIIAKVTRDAEMKKLSTKFPQYAFEAHKGYGTKRHLDALLKHGPSEAHRLTFIRKYLKLATSVLGL